MSKIPALAGKADDLSYVHVKIPLWLKRKVVRKAADNAQNLSTYLKELLIRDVGPRDVRRPEPDATGAAPARVPEARGYFVGEGNEERRHQAVLDRERDREREREAAAEADAAGAARPARANAPGSAERPNVFASLGGELDEAVPARRRRRK